MYIYGQYRKKKYSMEWKGDKDNDTTVAKEIFRLALIT